MKKRIALLLATVLAVGTLATACGGNEGGKDAKVKVGLGVHVDQTYASKDADATAEEGKQNGTTQADLHVAAVTIDADGKIVSVDVDSIQIKATFDPTGAVVAGTEQSFKTKEELGFDYNMVKYGPQPPAAIGKEWFEQSEAFEKYVVGMTKEQVEALLGTDGYTTDETLKAGCTIKVNGLVPAVVRAIEDAQANSFEAASTDKLALGVVGETAKAQFDAENLGASQAYANFVAVTSDKDGKITNCVLDSVQVNFTWDATGKITSDLTKEPTTKYDLKEGYNMKGASAGKGNIEGGAEWYEQADAFMKFVKGMTADQVKGISTDESGYVTDETLKAGCTMKISAYQAAVAKALAK